MDASGENSGETDLRERVRERLSRATMIVSGFRTFWG